VQAALTNPVAKRAERAPATLLRKLLPREQRYWLLVLLTGVSSGLLAVALEKLLKFVQGYAWGADQHILDAAQKLASTSPAIVVLVPTVGGMLVAALLLFQRRGELQGTTAMLEALTLKKGRLQPLRALAESVAAMTAVGTGASVGREGSMIYSGAAIGSWLGVKCRLEDHQVRMLLACGAAGGIAAAYNVPIGATVFAMEVLLGSFALELFGPIIISSVISTLISQSMLGNLPTYVVPTEDLVLVNEWEIAIDLVLGALMGVVSVGFIRVFSGWGRVFNWLQPLNRVRPVIAMAILGVTGLFFPQIFGNGYDTVNLVLKSDLLSNDAALPLGLLILLPVLKIVMTALCRVGGVPGGLFTPSLFIGALLGSAFGIGVNALLPAGSVAQPGAYALVGMGSILAGTLHAPIAAVLLVYEMTLDYGIILPLMSACIASAIVSHLLQGGSLYTEPLRRLGIHLPSVTAPFWLRQPSVERMIELTTATVSPAERFTDVMDKFLKAPEGEDQLYVVNREQKYLGTISLHEIKRFFRETEHLDSVIAADIVNPRAPHVFVHDPVSSAIEILAESEAERLPVLDSPASRTLLGTVSKRRLLAVYSEANLARRE